MRKIWEVEPNNMHFEVHDLGPISPENPILLSGQLNSADDTQDWFYIHPTVSGNITDKYSSDRGQEATITKYFDASEKVPYNTALEQGDEGVFNYHTELTLAPAPAPGPLPVPPSPDRLLPEPPPPPDHPVPMPGPRPEGPHIVGHVPAYDQSYDPGVNLGCTPVAIASVLGYWDQKGYDRLFTADGWDALKETKNVEVEVTSRNHMDRYYD